MGQLVHGLDMSRRLAHSGHVIVQHSLQVAARRASHQALVLAQQSLLPGQHGYYAAQGQQGQGQGNDGHRARAGAEKTFPSAHTSPHWISIACIVPQAAGRRQTGGSGFGRRVQSGYTYALDSGESRSTSAKIVHTSTEQTWSYL